MPDKENFLIRIAAGDINEILDAVSEMLADSGISSQARRDRALSGKVNMAEYVADRIEALSQNGRT